MRILVLTLLLFSSVLTFAQYWGGQEIKTSDLSPWIPKFQIEYQGTYDFGESESESDLHLFFSGGCLIGQVRSGYWEEGTGVRKIHYITLTNVEIDKQGGLTSDQHSGQFIRLTTKEGKSVKGLRIDNPWTCWIDSSEFEVGTRRDFSADDVFSGRFIEASTRKLQLKELRKLSSENRRIMRNEVFARYGYIFKEGGEMDIYFRKKSWYRGQHKNVSSFLTEIELHNIELIKKIE